MGLCLFGTYFSVTHGHTLFSVLAQAGSVCAALWRCRQNLVSTINGIFFSLSSLPVFTFHLEGVLCYIWLDKWGDVQNLTYGSETLGMTSSGSEEMFEVDFADR
jgi:hypothetical protein